MEDKILDETVENWRTKLSRNPVGGVTIREQYQDANGNWRTQEMVTFDKEETLELLKFIEEIMI